MVWLQVDGREVDVEPGTTVKAAAELAGIRIPGLCDHPDLPPYGGCRLCIVEVEGMRGYPSSCTLPVGEGMKVRTDTPALKDMRREILGMLLSEHPSICLTCQRAGRCDQVRASLRKVPQTMGCRYCPADGRCQLQEVVKMVGLDQVESAGPGSEEVVRSPFFDRDPNLCILCGRCVRVCQEVRGLGAISFTGRGHETKVGTAFDRPLQDVGCRFCGACVDSCPTGSLEERAGRWAGLAEGRVATFCPYCSANCPIELEVREGRMLRSRPGGQSRLCVRGRFGLEFVGHPDRLKSPLVRKGGRLVEASWEEALQAAARGLEGLDAAIGGKGSQAAERSEAWQAPERSEALQAPEGEEGGEGVEGGEGEEGGDGPGLAVLASGCLSNEALFLLYKFWQALPGKTLAFSDPKPAIDSGFALPEDLPERTVLVVGDLAAVNPALDLELRVGSTGPRIVVSALRNLLARKASVWVRPTAGAEARALEAMARAMMDEGLASPGARTARGWEEFSASLESVDRLAGESGVAAEDVRAAAWMLSGEDAVVVVGPDCPEETARAAANLALLAGASFCPLVRHCNSRGVEAMRMLQGVVEARSSGSGDYNQHQDPRRDKNRNTYPDLLDRIPEKMRRAYLVGDNPAGARPDLAKRLSGLDFLVVQDLFLTETAALADVVLPAASFAEIDGTLTGQHGLLGIRRAVPPPGQARPDWWIVSRLGRALGLPGLEADNQEMIFQEMVAALPGSRRQEEPSFFNRGGDEEGEVPSREQTSEGSSKDTSEGTSETSLDVSSHRSSERLLWLVVGESLYRFDSGARTGRVSDLRYLTRERTVWIHPRDASALEIQDGDPVRVEMEEGSLQARARHSRDLSLGTLHMWRGPQVAAVMKGRAVARARVIRYV
ncbi:MAG: molybdopterin-dependent oxidoreductase [Methanosarcinales archaeon]|nr:molybdopterin-dependent oxidoreductase [Methanosarcinales archaeon]